MSAAKILVVEDEIITAEAIADQLQQLGYVLAGIASSGRSAIEKAAATQPDLVLMDIILKRRQMDGIEAAVQIQQRFKIPVVYLTAHSDQATLARAKVTCPFGYILKPFSEKDLRIALENALYKHQMERQLAEREELLSTIFESTSNAILSCDRAGTITYTNAAAESLTGWPIAEAKGQSITEVIQIVDEMTCKPIENPVAILLQEEIKSCFNGEIAMLSRDGTSIPIESNICPMFKGTNNLAGAVMVLADLRERRQVEVLEEETRQLSAEVAERRESEAKMRQILAAEREVNDLKSRLISIVSHEFRTPLAVVLASAELLKHYSSQLSPEKKDQYFSRIHAGVKQLTQLIDDILTFGKAEANELRFHPESMDLEAFCQNLVENQRLIAGDRYTIQFSYQSTCTTASFDEQLLQRVLSNLLTNAVKYSPKDSIVCFSVSDRDNRILFQVEDRGIGIPKKDQANLFTPFSRASNVGSIVGTGMGMSIVKKCVDLHGGEISVESEENKGTTFIVSLPLDRTG